MAEKRKDTKVIKYVPEAQMYVEYRVEGDKQIPTLLHTNVGRIPVSSFETTIDKDGMLHSIYYDKKGNIITTTITKPQITREKQNSSEIPENLLDFGMGFLDNPIMGNLIKAPGYASGVSLGSALVEQQAYPENFEATAYADQYGRNFNPLLGTGQYTVDDPWGQGALQKFESGYPQPYSPTLFPGLTDKNLTAAEKEKYKNRNFVPNTVPPTSLQQLDKRKIFIK